MCLALNTFFLIPFLFFVCLFVCCFCFVCLLLFLVCLLLRCLPVNGLFAVKVFFVFLAGWGNYIHKIFESISV